MTLLANSDFKLIVQHEPKMVTCERFVTEFSEPQADFPSESKLSLFEYQAKLDIPAFNINGYTNYFTKCITTFRKLKEFCQQEFGDPYVEDIADFRWYGNLRDESTVIYLKTRADALHLKLTWDAK